MKIFNRKPIIAKNLLGNDIVSVRLYASGDGKCYDIFVHYSDYKDGYDHFSFVYYKDALHDFKILVGKII